MPKVNKKSSNKLRLSPYDGKSQIDHSRICEKANGEEFCYRKEKSKWEESRCPICMDHPHNAVLLICSSHEKGCRPYMCDTDNLLSNCFDQFCNLYSVIPSRPKPVDQQGRFVCSGDSGRELACPLCRGQIRGWIVAKGARKFMNKMVRGCSLDSCDFCGNYAELKKHAMLDHPSARPSQVDNDRKQNFQNVSEDQEHEFWEQHFGNDQYNNMSDDDDIGDDEDEDLESDVFWGVELIPFLDANLSNFDDFAPGEELLTREYSLKPNDILQYTTTTNMRKIIEYYDCSP